jgi:hypothetical protein
MGSTCFSGWRVRRVRDRSFLPGQELLEHICKSIYFGLNPINFGVDSFVLSSHFGFEIVDFDIELGVVSLNEVIRGISCLVINVIEFVHLCSDLIDFFGEWVDDVPILYYNSIEDFRVDYVD